MYFNLNIREFDRDACKDNWNRACAKFKAAWKSDEQFESQFHTICLDIAREMGAVVTIDENIETKKLQVTFDFTVRVVSLLGR